MNDISSISDTERLNRLRLLRSENVGPVSWRQLMEAFGSGTKALEALPEMARRGGRKRPYKICSKSVVEDEWAATEAAGARLLSLGEPDYPTALAATSDAPPLISILGHSHLLNRRCVGMVGARNASASGIRFARQIAQEMGKKELVVASGLARGIDGAAHQGALASGTIAVVAGGVDVVYPAEHQELYEQIIDTGVIVAEQPAGTKPQGRHFPRRNRVISGLSLGILVIEAAKKSGSLITARMANEQGREVMAVPGSPLDPRCRGSNDLIRQGARLVETIDDVIEALGGMIMPSAQEPEPDLFNAARPAPPSDQELENARKLMQEKLGPTPTPIDELVRQCHLTAAVVFTILLELELAGRLERHPGNQVSLLDVNGLESTPEAI
jgi:DNA processing protein